MEDAIETLLSEARIKLAAHEWSEACILLERVLQLNPDVHSALFQLALTLIKLNKQEAALKHAKHALKLKPSDYDSLMTYCAILQLMHRDSECVDYLKKAIASNPSNPFPYLSMGRSLIALRKYISALTYLKQANEIGPDNHDVHTCMGVAYEHMGDIASALQYYRKSLANWKGSTDIVFHYVQLLFCLNDMDVLHGFIKSVKKTACLDDLHNAYLHALDIVLNFTQHEMSHVNELLEIESKVNFKKSRLINTDLLALYVEHIKHIQDFIELRPEYYRQSRNENQIYVPGATRSKATPIYLLGGIQSIGLSYLKFNLGDIEYETLPLTFFDLQVRHFSDEQQNLHMARINKRLEKLPEASIIYVVAGYEDCLTHFGFYQEVNSNDIELINQRLDNTIESYLSFIKSLIANYKHDITVVTTPSYFKQDVDEHSDFFTKLVMTFNDKLVHLARQENLRVLKLHKYTQDLHGKVQKKFYLADNLVRPDIFVGALKVQGEHNS